VAEVGIFKIYLAPIQAAELNASPTPVEQLYCAAGTGWGSFPQIHPGTALQLQI